jgi:hypothetical protein
MLEQQASRPGNLTLRGKRTMYNSKVGLDGSFGNGKGVSSLPSLEQLAICSKILISVLRIHAACLCV